MVKEEEERKNEGKDGWGEEGIIYPESQAPKP